MQTVALSQGWYCTAEWEKVTHDFQSNPFCVSLQVKKKKLNPLQYIWKSAADNENCSTFLYSPSWKNTLKSKAIKYINHGG